jgi:hypothetical protein
MRILTLEQSISRSFSDLKFLTCKFLIIIAYLMLKYNSFIFIIIFTNIGLLNSSNYSIFPILPVSLHTPLSQDTSTLSPGTLHHSLVL